MPRDDGFINICTILNIEEKNYLDTSLLMNELYEVLSLLPDIKIIKYKPALTLVFSFVYQSETYFFKYDSRADVYVELIYEEVCKLLHIPYLSSDIAKLGNIYGNISKNYKKEGARYINGYQVLKEAKLHVASGDASVLAPHYYVSDDEEDQFMQDTNISFYNSLEGIWAALEIRYQNHPHMREVIAKLMKQIVNMFVVDLLLGANDRTMENWEIEEKNNGDVNLVPIFDNSRCMLTHPEFTSLAMTTNTKTKFLESDLLPDSLTRFLRQSSLEFASLVEKYSFVLTSNYANKILSSIEEKIGRKLSSELKTEFLTKFAIYNETIQMYLNDLPNHKR